MFNVFKNASSILFGLFLLMVGNAVHSNLLAFKGDEEGFSAIALSLVMSSYFAGFLLGSNVTTSLIKRVGHVRVFAAFGSFISAAFIAFPLIPNELVWMFARFMIGMCYAGVYIVTESWLNSSVENEERGMALSLYLVVQMLGIILGGWMITVFNVSGYELFVIISILVSLSFAPILLSMEKAPIYETTEAMSLKELYISSPLGVVSMFFTGGAFALQFSMMGVFATARGFGVNELFYLIMVTYVGGLLFQFPIGWLSDRVDRRLIIILIGSMGALGLIVLNLFSESTIVVYIMGFLMGSLTNPLYSLTLAYVNDRVAWEKMASASSGLVFITGVGAIGAPLMAGYLMQVFGAEFYWYIVAIFLGIIACFGIYRSSVREAVEFDETAVFQTMAPAASPVFVEIAQEIVSEQVEAALDDATVEE